jgi:hypothetical protein
VTAMPHAALSELAGLAASLAPAHAALLARARAFGALYGVEVLDLHPAGGDGVWEVRLRPRPASPDAPTPAEATVSDERRIPRTPPDPPFASPVRGSRAFEGDGTHDMLRFVAEADPVVRVPPRGAGASGGPPPRLSDEERLRMLPATIAGDALLSLQHQGLDRDPAAVEQALRQGREHFAAEVARSGAGERTAELLALYDTASATARRQLLEGA